ncbi:MAG: Nucleolar protein 16 [Trichoglossum hirsutum]|nr:MAG: Nucleolar protein 16 [Trichoglossum hirsutum]
MGRELQKKKNRSSNSKVKRRSKSRRVNILGNPIVAANWDQSLTLSQNYKRLGLTAKIKHSTGGIEKSASSSSDSPTDVLAATTKKQTKLLPGEARIERAPDGSILRVIHAPPVIADLGAVSDEDVDADDGMAPYEQAPSTDVVRQLEEQAKRGVAKALRTQSAREQEWIERLVSKYGDDYRKMFWDRKLNPMQQSEGDIRKRVLRWKLMREKGMDCG